MDNCEVREALPEIAPVDPFCHNDPGLITRLSGLAGTRCRASTCSVSGTFRSDPGLPLQANYVVTPPPRRRRSAAPPSGDAPTSWSISSSPVSFGDRVNEVDLRVAKILRFGRTRTNVGLDIYNLFNASAVLTYNQAFNPGGRWLVPTTVMSARFAKLSASIDF